MYMFNYTSTKNVPSKLQMYIDNSHNVGSFVAIKDQPDDTHYHLTKILSVDEHTTTMHYYVTYGNRLRTAVWKPLYKLPHTNQIVIVTRYTVRLRRVVDS